MSQWFKDNSQTIGRTPLVRLNRIIDDAPATVLAKIEGRNPAYSVKCRIGTAMIEDAESRGLLQAGKELVLSDGLLEPPIALDHASPRIDDRLVHQ